MFKGKLASCSLLFLGLTCAGSAVQASSAKAEIKAISVQLIDLDTRDGITPALTFASSGDVFSTYGVYNRFDTWEGAAYYYGTVIGGYDTGFAWTTVQPDNISSEAMNWGEDSLATSSGSHTLRFNLTANTLAIFSAPTAMATDRQGGGWGRSLATLYGSVNGDQTFYDQFAAPGGPMVYAGSGMLNGELHSGAGGASGEIRFTTEAFALSAVPEPGTWGMLLAGLGVLGAAARRQRHV